MNHIIKKAAIVATLVIGAISAPAFAQATSPMMPNDMTVLQTTAGQMDMGNQNSMMQMMMQMQKMMQQNMGNATGGIQNMMGTGSAQNMMDSSSPDQVKSFFETMTAEQRNLFMQMLQETESMGSTAQ